MKKILFLFFILSVSSVLSGQETENTIANSYFRIDEKYFESQLFFLDSGNLILKSIGQDTYSKREPLYGRYIRQKDRILLTPSRREAFFEVAYRQNPEIKKGKVQLIFNMKDDEKEINYALQNDTLINVSVLEALDESMNGQNLSSQKIIVEKDYQSTLILSKKVGRDQFVMTYTIPEDANELYIEYFGYDSESAMLYVLSVHHEPNSNELTLNYNIRGEEEPPVKAYYIRPVTAEDYSGISFPIDRLLYGYSYLDPIDFYYSIKEYESERYDDSSDYEEEMLMRVEKGEKLSDKERWDLLYYNKTVLAPLIKAKGRQTRKAAEEYFTNIFTVKGDKYNDYSYGWYYFSEEFNNDTTDICPSNKELDELLNIYAEIELKNNKPDTASIGIIYRYYSDIYYCEEPIPLQLSASVRYFMKSAASITEIGLKPDDSKTVWQIMETLLQCINFSDDTEAEQVYKEIMQLTPAYRDFLVMNYNNMYDRGNNSLFAEYLAGFKGWDMKQFRMHDEFLKKLDTEPYISYLRSNEHPIRFCGDLSWLLNRVATGIYRDSWDKKSPYLNEAVEWAELLVKLCIPSDLSKYLDTYACLLYQAGEKEKALQVAYLALNNLTEKQKDEFLGKKIKINYELIKQNRLASEQAWLE